MKSVKITPAIAKAGELVRINYNGLLGTDGAERVYVHLGYGDNWNYVQDLPMQKTEKGWQKVFPVEHPGQINFCFRDSANNWDNNSGMNWRCSVELTNYNLKTNEGGNIYGL